MTRRKVGNDVDRAARLKARRLIRALRADCILYGCDEKAVARWPLERLVDERRRALQRLMRADH